MRSSSWVAIVIAFFAVAVAMLENNALGTTDWYDDGTHVAQRSGGNFYGLSGITVTTTDNPGNSRVDLGLSVVSADLSFSSSSFYTFDASSGTDPQPDVLTDTLIMTGGTGIDLTGDSAADSLTFAIDSTVTTLTGSQTLTNKTLTSPTIQTSPTAAGATWTNLGTVTTADINGGTIDGVSIGDSSAATVIRVDSLSLNGTAISSSGDLTISPVGDTLFPNLTGVVVGHGSQVTTDTTLEVQVLGTGSADTRVLIAAWRSNVNAPILEFMKSRDTTIGSNTIVQDNDIIGAVAFLPDDGVDFATNAAAFSAVVSDSTPAAGDIGMAFRWQQMPGGGGGLTETMRLDHNGNLGLGNSVNPGAGSATVTMTDGTAPASMASNSAGIYANDVAGTTELFAIDESGTATQLSPHPADFLAQVAIGCALPFAENQSNPYLGKQIYVDWCGLIMAVEALAGQQFLFVSDLPAEDRRDWYEDQKRLKGDWQSRWDTAQALYDDHIESGELVAAGGVVFPKRYDCEHPPRWMQDRGVTAQPCP